MFHLAMGFFLIRKYLFSWASVFSFVNFPKFHTISEEENYVHGALLEGILRKNRRPTSPAR